MTDRIQELAREIWLAGSLHSTELNAVTAIAAKLREAFAPQIDTQERMNALLNTNIDNNKTIKDLCGKVSSLTAENATLKEWVREARGVVEKHHYKKCGHDGPSVCVDCGIGEGYSCAKVCAVAAFLKDTEGI